MTRGSAEDQLPEGARVLPPRPRLRAPATGAALLLVTVAAYLPVGQAGYIWDDDHYVEHNELLRSTDGLYRIWFQPTASPQYYPLVFTTFWIEYRLWGLAPAGYHAVNVLLHAANALLLWRLLHRLGVPGAWLAAAVFALHPVHVESVAWVTERKNTLSAFLYLAALAAYLRFAPPQSPVVPSRRALGWYALALVLFAGALLSKTVTCSWPAAVLVIRWWKRGRLSWRDVVPLLPFFALGAGLGLATVWIEKHHVGATGADWSLSPVERLLVGSRALWFYAWKLVWPAPLLFIYPRWQIDAHAPWQYVFVAATAGALVVLWLVRDRVGRGPLAAVLLFAGTLLPALGPFDVYPFRYSYVADHFQYLASIPLIALLAAVGVQAFRAAGPAAWPIGRGLAAGILAVLAILTWKQTQIYQDQESLWEDTLAKDPDCWMARYNLGQVFQRRGDYASAIREYRMALRLKPEALGHYNLATVLAVVGQTQEAMAQYRLALSHNPQLEEAHRGLGQVLLRERRTDEAAQEFMQATQLPPADALAWYQLGWIRFRQGRSREALACAERALDLEPGSKPMQALHDAAQAWILATHPAPQARNGARALELAMRANQWAGAQEPAYLETLAAAYAENGDFAEAAAAAGQAADLAAADDEPEQARQIRARLAGYQARQPFRDQRLSGSPGP